MPNLQLARITPAGAGKTSRYTFGMGQSPGSPPQVRGKRQDSGYTYSRRRITPAGAGKTHYCPPSSLCNWDHPRRCGENYCRCQSCNYELGSPPQVRGKRVSVYSFAAVNRITPAGAGKTASNITAHFRREDHPRRCGENENI